MPKGPKVTADEQANIVSLAKGGKGIAEIARTVNRPESSVRGVLRRNGMAPIKTGEVPPEAAADPAASPGGLVAALSAASGETSGEGGASAGAEPDAAPPPPQPQAQPGAMDPQAAGKALVVAVDAITVGVCRVYAVRQKVKVTGKLAASWRLSQEEKAGLGAFAPYAAPYILGLLKHFDKIAAGVFALIYASVLSDRFQTIKDLSPVKDEKPAAPPAPPAPPAAPAAPPSAASPLVNPFAK